MDFPVLKFIQISIISFLVLTDIKVKSSATPSVPPPKKLKPL